MLMHDYVKFKLAVLEEPQNPSSRAVLTRWVWHRTVQYMESPELLAVAA